MLQSIMIQAELVKAFSENPQEGNPAGVIFDADNLTQEEMILIAAELGYSESAFVLQPLNSQNNIRLKFMTPTTEVDLCGHATIATAKAIFERSSFQTLNIEVNNGTIKVFQKDNKFYLQSNIVGLGEQFDANVISKLLGIDANDIRTDVPIQTASVGSSKLMIPVVSSEVIQRITPDYDAMVQFCKDNPNVKGFYPFAVKENDHFHARQFNPAAGINEDPITGVAGGALGVYKNEYKLINSSNIIIDQGAEVGKPGMIYVSVHKETVDIGGDAVIFGRREL